MDLYKQFHYLRKETGLKVFVDFPTTSLTVRTVTLTRDTSYNFIVSEMDVGGAPVGNK